VPSRIFEAEICWAIAAGPFAWSLVTELAARLPDRPPRSVRRAAEDLADRGILERWPDHPAGLALTLAPETADRLGLEISETPIDDRPHWIRAADLAARRPSHRRQPSGDMPRWLLALSPDPEPLPEPENTAAAPSPAPEPPLPSPLVLWGVVAQPMRRDHLCGAGGGGAGATALTPAICGLAAARGAALIGAAAKSPRITIFECPIAPSRWPNRASPRRIGPGPRTTIRAAGAETAPAAG